MDSNGYLAIIVLSPGDSKLNLKIFGALLDAMANSLRMEKIPVWIGKDLNDIRVDINSEIHQKFFDISLIDGGARNILDLVPDILEDYCLETDDKKVLLIVSAPQESAVHREIVKMNLIEQLRNRLAVEVIT